MGGPLQARLEALVKGPLEALSRGALQALLKALLEALIEVSPEVPLAYCGGTLETPLGNPPLVERCSRGFFRGSANEALHRFLERGPVQVPLVRPSGGCSRGVP